LRQRFIRNPAEPKLHPANFLTFAQAITSESVKAETTAELNVIA
jgi:hypothetical protein